MLCPLPPLSFGKWFGSPGFAGEASSLQLTSHALSAVAFEDALVSQVGSSLPSGVLVPGGERGFVLVVGEGPSSQGGFDSGHLLRIYTCIRTGLGRGGAHTSLIK